MFNQICSCFCYLWGLRFGVWRLRFCFVVVAFSSEDRRLQLWNLCLKLLGLGLQLRPKLWSLRLYLWVFVFSSWPLGLQLWGLRLQLMGLRLSLWALGLQLQGLRL